MTGDAIILAGGFGTRLKHVLPNIPKPMAPVASRPFLHFVLEHLGNEDICHCVLSVGYQADLIRKHFGTEYLGMKLTYEPEEEPLGTGGAVKASLKHVTEDQCFIINGDSLFRINMEKLFLEHQHKKADVTIALKPMTNFDRYGTVVQAQDGRITAFNEKKHMKKGLINGGVYLVNSNIFGGNWPEKFSIETDFFAARVAEANIFGTVFDDYFIDIGIPTDYERAQQQLS